MGTTSIDLFAYNNKCEGFATTSGEERHSKLEVCSYGIHIDAFDGLGIEIQLHVHLPDFIAALPLISSPNLTVPKSHLHIAV